MFRFAALSSAGQRTDVKEIQEFALEVVRETNLGVVIRDMVRIWETLPAGSMKARLEDKVKAYSKLTGIVTPVDPGLDVSKSVAVVKMQDIMKEFASKEYNYISNSQIYKMASEALLDHVQMQAKMIELAYGKVASEAALGVNLAKERAFADLQKGGLKEEPKVSV